MAKRKSSQTTLRSKKFGRQVLKARHTQTGTSNLKRDAAIKKRAMQPGKRIEVKTCIRCGRGAGVFGRMV